MEYFMTQVLMIDIIYFLQVFNSFSSETNDHNIEMNYKQINVSTPNSASQYFNNDNVYYMPMKEF